MQHECSLVNLLHVFRTPFPKNTNGGLLLMPLSSLMRMVMNGKPYALSTTPSKQWNKKNGRKLTLNENNLATRIKKIKKVSECTKDLSTS